ncbi:MAG TPA: 2-C-methyl-D-erythritol 4-phosphate cytidylyltransferase [Thermoanaerobaculia bacterium]|nr:2-C-methyl-D-erythritol 4-phosphate cytidylyltransferase [Thermoanaerobaculia bacterium]
MIIPAAGSGSRFGGPIPKQYRPLRGKPIVAHAVDRFLSDSTVSRLILAVAPKFRDHVEDLVRVSAWNRVTIVAGGETRFDSVRNALEGIREDDDVLVAVHDAVRPFFTLASFHHLLDLAQRSGGAIPVVPVSDTIHRVRDGLLFETPDRHDLVAAQTPQCFRLEVLRHAMAAAADAGYRATDEAGAVRRSGGEVRIVEGDSANIKITRDEDLLIAESNYDRWSIS